MSSRLLRPNVYELASRSSLDSEETLDLNDLDFESQHPINWQFSIRRSPLLSKLLPSYYTGYRTLKPRRRSKCSRRLYLYFLVFTGTILLLLAITAIFRPSYTYLPPHYALLRKRALESHAPGRGNPRNESIFIAASLYDRGGELTGGQWGRAVLELINLLGKDNVFLSIYENDSGPEGRNALRNLEAQVTCDKSLVFEEHLDLKTLPTVTVPGGSKRIKRIEYLAEVRNRALRPLDDHPERRYDKLLFLNDVVFDPIDAIQLLFSTNAAEQGAANYRAACAVDFSNPFKFYDTFATRDLQGYSMGVPFFPWFSSAGRGESRNDVLAEKDAVRVRSCWGGMVAFDARFFQHGESHSFPSAGHTLPVRFRAGQDLFWEGSECCIVHADIQDAPSDVDAITDTGIYMNPFVRVAYDGSTLSWLRFTRRFERLYPFIHSIVNHIASMPHANARRTEVPGQTVNETVWIPDGTAEGGGSFQSIIRTAGNDGFCGRRELSVIVEYREKGQKGWEVIRPPDFGNFTSFG